MHVRAPAQQVTPQPADDTNKNSQLTSEQSNKTLSQSYLSTISRAKSVSRTLTLELYLAAVVGSNSTWRSLRPTLLASQGHSGTGALRMMLYMFYSDSNKTVGHTHLYPNSTDGTIWF